MIRYAIVLLAALPLQDGKKGLKPVNANMEKVACYHFTVKAVIDAEEKLSWEGEYFRPDVLHLRTDKGELARKGDKILVKPTGEEWKEPEKPDKEEKPDPKKPGKKPVKNDLTSMTSPHAAVAKIAEACPDIKRDKSTRLDGRTVDMYIYALGAKNAEDILIGTLHPLWLALIDRSKTKNGVLFYVGRDELYYRMEIRFESLTPKGKTATITINFSEYGKAKCKLPKEVKEKLGIK